MCSKLEAALQPTALVLQNDSQKHAGHYGKDGSAASDAGETHFKLAVVSGAFAGVSLVKRHQMVYALLDGEFKAGLHALALTTKTPEEAAAAAGGGRGRGSR